MSSGFFVTISCFDLLSVVLCQSLWSHIVQYLHASFVQEGVQLSEDCVQLLLRVLDLSEEIIPDTCSDYSMNKLRASTLGIVITMIVYIADVAALTAERTTPLPVLAIRYLIYSRYLIDNYYYGIIACDDK